MKSMLLLTTSLLVLPAALAAQDRPDRDDHKQPHYTLTDLGPAGNPFSQGTFINSWGLITGIDTAPDGTAHAVFFDDGLVKDISTPGLGGLNSGAFGANDRGQVAGQGETTAKDLNHENFCGYGTGLQCLPFIWHHGVTTALRTLGGTNGSPNYINNVGQLAGYAENSHRDHDCRRGVSVNGTGPQVLDFEAVVWGPKQGEIRELRTLPGDTVGMAFGINDLGQAVGTSGTCANTVLPGLAGGPHAVLWETDGSVHDLGSLGGTIDPTVLGSGTIAFVINNRSQVTGAAALPGNAVNHPFFWTREEGMQDLGVLHGDVTGAGLGMNDRGEVVGASISAPGLPTGKPRAFLWRNGHMRDLNTLVPAHAPMYLLTAFGINDDGLITGFGVVTRGPDAGKIHAFLATPRDDDDDRTHHRRD